MHQALRQLWGVDVLAAAPQRVAWRVVPDSLTLHCSSLGSRCPAARSHRIVCLLARRFRWSIDCLVEWRDALRPHAVRGVSGFAFTPLSMGASGARASTAVSLKHVSLLNLLNHLTFRWERKNYQSIDIIQSSVNGHKPDFDMVAFSFLRHHVNGPIQRVCNVTSP